MSIITKQEIDELLKLMANPDFRTDSNSQSKKEKNKQHIKPTKCDNCPKKKTCKGNADICSYK